MPCTRVKWISVTVLWHFGHFWHWARKRIQCNISRYNFGKLQHIVINAVIVISIIPALIFVLFRRKNKEYTPVMLERERKTSEIWKQNHTRASGGVQKLDSVAWETETESVISENSGFKIRQESKRSSFLVLHKKHFHYKYLCVCLEISILCSQTGENIMYLTLLLKSYFLHPIITPEIYVLKIHRQFGQPIHKLTNL